MTFDKKNPVTLAGVNEEGSEVLALALQSSKFRSRKSKEQAHKVFDSTRLQANSLKLMAALMAQEPARCPSYKVLPSVKRLNQIFEYEQKSGNLISKIVRGGLKVGSISGLVNPDRHGGYVIVYVDNVPYRAHRIVFKMIHGRDPIDQLDHIDGNRANNRIENLREVTPLQNTQNRTRCKSNTGLIGVSFCKASGLFLACIGANGRTVHLGAYTELECAHAARLHAEGILFDLPKPIAGRDT